jgi:hypothetical protein
MKMFYPFSQAAHGPAPLSPSQGSGGIEADTMRQWALLLAPPLLIGSMWAAFRGFCTQLGPKISYFAAFVCYWLVWCLAFPLWILQGSGLAHLFCRAVHPLGKMAWLGLLLLLFPAVWRRRPRCC